MAAIHEPIAGFYGSFSIKKGGTTWFKVGHLRDVTLNIEAGEIDTTSHDTREWSTYIAGFKRWTLNCGALYIDDPTDASGDDNAPYGEAQHELFDLLAGESKLNTILIRIMPTGIDVSGTPDADQPAATEYYYEGTGTIGRWSLATGQTEAAMINVEIRGKSALTKTVAA